MTMNGAVAARARGPTSFVPPRRSRASAPNHLNGNDPRTTSSRVHGSQHSIYPPRPPAEHGGIRGRQIIEHSRGRTWPRFNSILHLPAYQHARSGRDRPVQEPGFSARRRPLEYARFGRRALVIDDVAGRLFVLFSRDRHGFFMEIASCAPRALFVVRASMTDLGPRSGPPMLRTPLPDVGRVAHRAGPLQQHRPRTAYEAAAAKCSGDASLHTNSFPTRPDRACLPPISHAVIGRRNTQLILAERRVSRTVIGSASRPGRITSEAFCPVDRQWAGRSFQEVEKLGWE